jgi:hypothetical protein
LIDIRGLGESVLSGLLVGFLVRMMLLVLLLKLNEITLGRSDISGFLRSVLEIGSEMFLDGSSNFRFREGFGTLLEESLVNRSGKGLNFGADSSHGSSLGCFNTVHISNAEEETEDSNLGSLFHF